ncbi:hypothetical protein QTI45_31680 [Variovorax sp. J22R187]|uniref:hypothetical protein n=1 Tax=Variovorax saccharolyticus TaxID=3053516 RepID=UPI0025768959|nr:hypothetical protein [Variovorax sp. J22R187]MDM0022194.1 hypothetical protein [Variovorax sp. J22R187]
MNPSLVSVLLAMSAAVFGANVSAQPAPPSPRVIQQGSISAGCALAAATGGFDSRNPLQSAGQTYRGDTHFAFSDLKNVQIADLVSKFLADKKPD